MTSTKSAAPGGLSQRGSHRLSLVGTCKRKWWFHQFRKLRPRSEPTYFVEGRLIHIALAYHRAIQMVARGQTPPAWYTEQPNGLRALEEAGVGYPDAVELAKSVFVAYREFYGDDEGWKTESIEHEYTATLGQIRQLMNGTHVVGSLADDGEVFSARIDLLVRARGFIWGVDYKSTKTGNSKGRLGDFNPEGEFGLHWQFLLQTAILRVNFGTDFRGVIVERVLKSTPHDFMRSPVPIAAMPYYSLPDTLRMLTDAERELTATATLVQRLEYETQRPSDYLPPGSFWSCFSYGRPCEFRALCTAADAGQRRETMVREYHTVE